MEGKKFVEKRKGGGGTTCRNYRSNPMPSYSPIEEAKVPGEGGIRGTQRGTEGPHAQELYALPTNSKGKKRRLSTLVKNCRRTWVKDEKGGGGQQYFDIFSSTRRPK